MENSYRILVLLPGPVAPELDASRNRFSFLSSGAKGDILLPVWWASEEQAREKLGGRGFPEWQMGNFLYHLHLLYAGQPALRGVRRFMFYVSTALRLKQSGGRYDAVISYGANLTGVVGVILKWFGVGPLILEVPGAPAKAFVFDSPAVSVRVRIKKFIADHLFRFVSANADHIRILYPEQLAGFPCAERKPLSVFHEFVPVSSIQAGEGSEPIILCLGFPWYLKGVDLLIGAFQQIANYFPEYRLVIVGHVPDPAPLRALIAENPRIEIRRAVPYAEAISLIERCGVLALPSRTEAMGRVLLEAMAAHKPIIAARVDGIPHYVADGENGLLFRPSDSADLAEKLKTVMSQTKLANDLAASGYERVRTRWSEAEYTRRYIEMLETVSVGNLSRTNKPSK